MHAWLPPEVEVMTDTSEADWVVAALRPWDEDGVRVGSFMPDVFEAYVRLDHFGGELMDEEAVRRFRELVSLLSEGTPPGDPCWFCLWDGWGTWWKGAHGVLRSRSGPRRSRQERRAQRATTRGEQRIDDERNAVLRRTPRVQGEHRVYFLMRGPLSAVESVSEAAGQQAPNLWWPANRSWLVSTEIDGDASYVGGSKDLVGAVVASTRLDAVETSVSARLA